MSKPRNPSHQRVCFQQTFGIPSLTLFWSCFNQINCRNTQLKKLIAYTDQLLADRKIDIHMHQKYMMEGDRCGDAPSLIYLISQIETVHASPMSTIPGFTIEKLHQDLQDMTDSIMIEGLDADDMATKYPLYLTTLVGNELSLYGDQDILNRMHGMNILEKTRNKELATYVGISTQVSNS